MTLFSFWFAGLLGGSVVIEVIFNIPGMGRLLYTAVLNNDVPVIQGGMMLDPDPGRADQHRDRPPLRRPQPGDQGDQPCLTHALDPADPRAHQRPDDAAIGAVDRPNVCRCCCAVRGAGTGPSTSARSCSRWSWWSCSSPPGSHRTTRPLRTCTQPARRAVGRALVRHRPPRSRRAVPADVGRPVLCHHRRHHAGHLRRHRHRSSAPSQPAAAAGSTSW